MSGFNSVSSAGTRKTYHFTWQWRNWKVCRVKFANILCLTNIFIFYRKIQFCHWNASIEDALMALWSNSPRDNAISLQEVVQLQRQGWGRIYDWWEIVNFCFKTYLIFRIGGGCGGNPIRKLSTKYSCVLCSKFRSIVLSFGQSYYCIFFKFRFR